MAFDWDEFDAAASGVILTHLEMLIERFPIEPAYEFLVHCNADYKQIFCYLNTRPQNYGQPGVVRYPKYPDHPPREPEGLDYTLSNWNSYDLNDEIDENARQDPRADRWLACMRSVPPHESDEEQFAFVEEFLRRVCRVAVRLQSAGAFEKLPREPSFILHVQDHDEWHVDSWKRLIHARIELHPPWAGGTWPHGGRHPDIAACIFDIAADYHERQQIREGSYLLREAIALLPELQGPEIHAVEGSDIQLPIPANEAWARAYMAVVVHEHYSDDDKCNAAMKKAQQLAPDLADVHRALSTRHWSSVPSEELDGSVADLDVAIRLDPTRVEFYATRAELRARPYYPFWPQALRDYTKAHELDPFNQRWLMKRAGVLIQLNDLEAAVADYSRVFELRNEELSWYCEDAVIGRAECLEKLGRYAEAVEDWTRVISYRESTPEYHRSRARCYRGLKNEPAALADEQEAKRIQGK